MCVIYAPPKPNVRISFGGCKNLYFDMYFEKVPGKLRRCIYRFLGFKVKLI